MKTERKGRKGRKGRTRKMGRREGKKERLFLSAVVFATLGLVTVVGCASASGATPPAEEWRETFGGAGIDWAYSVQQTTDGGYIVAGFTDSYGAGDSDFWLVKTEANGTADWDKTFGGTSREVANSVQQTTDGGYILAGLTTSYGAGDSDFWLVKTDANGTADWDKTFGGARSDWAESVQQTADGGFILAGLTTSYGAGDSDFWLVKTDANGTAEWDKTFGGAKSDGATSVQQTADGGYILAGYTYSYSSGVGDKDFWLVKTDADGNLQWDRTFGGSYDDWVSSVQQTTDGGYILAGYTRSYGAGSYDFWLVKTDFEGNLQWDKTFGGVGWDGAYSVQQTADGGFILAGRTYSYGAGSYDAWLVKTDFEGNLQWDKTFGGTSKDEAHSVQQTADGGYILAGYTISYGAGSYDFWLVKLEREELTEPIITIYTDKYEYSPGDTLNTTIVFKNPTASSVDTYFVWYLDWMPISVTPLTLPPNFDQAYEVSIPVGDWVPFEFDAVWYVALLEPTAPYATICEDTADWKFVPTRTTASTQEQAQEQAQEQELTKTERKREGEGEKKEGIPKEVAEEIAKKVGGVEFAT